MTNNSAAAAAAQERDKRQGILSGLRVVEYGNETSDYAGLVLAGLGAEVIRIEPPEGSPGRRIGPFLGDVAGPDRSLFFWNYNRGKKSAVLDLRTQEGRAGAEVLIGAADVLLDSGCGSLHAALSVTREQLQQRHPALIVARALN